MVDKIKLSDILGKFSNGIDKFANKANKDNNDVLDAEEWSVFMNDIERGKSKNKVSNEQYQALLGLELSAKGKAISKLTEEEQAIAVNYDADKDGHLDTKEMNRFNKAVADIKAENARKTAIASAEYTDTEKATHMTRLDETKAYKYDAAGNNKTMAADAVVIAREALEEGDLVKDAVDVDNQAEAKDYVNNKDARDLRVSKHAAYITGIEDIKPENVKAAIEKDIVTEYKKVGGETADHFKFELKSQEVGSDKVEYSFDLDLSNLKNIKRSDGFDLADVKTAVMNLQTAKDNATTHSTEIVNEIKIRKDEIEKNNTQIKEQNKSIKDATKAFMDAINNSLHPISSKASEKIKGKAVDDLSDENKKVYYKDVLYNALNGNIPFKLKEDNKTFELDLTGDAKDAYEYLKSNATELKLDTYIENIIASKKEIKRHQDGSIAAMREVSILECAQDELTNVIKIIDNHLTTNLKHQHSMERVEEVAEKAMKKAEKLKEKEQKRTKTANTKTDKATTSHNKEAKNVSGAGAGNTDTKKDAAEDDKAITDAKNANAAQTKKGAKVGAKTKQTNADGGSLSIYDSEYEDEQAAYNKYFDKNKQTNN